MKNILIKVGIVAQSLVGMRAGAEGPVATPATDDPPPPPTEQTIATTTARESANTYYIDAIVTGPDTAQAAVLGHVGATDTVRIDTTTAAQRPLHYGFAEGDSVDVDSVSLADALARIRAPTVAPPSLSQADRHAFYLELIKRSGAEPFHDAGNKSYAFHTLLLRGVDQLGQHHATRINNHYDDVLVLLGKDGSVQEFVASAHPTFIVENSVTPEPNEIDPDTRRGGKGGVAMVNAGHTFKLVPYSGMYGLSFQVQGWNGTAYLNRVPATRNGPGIDSMQFTKTAAYRMRVYDDVFTASDRPSTASDIALHAGMYASLGNTGAAGTWVGANNIGCFNLAPDDMNTYNAATARGTHVLTLLDANTAYVAAAAPD